MSSALQPHKYLNKLLGQNVLVLGGTSGQGFSVAEASLEYGASVTISGSSQEKLKRALSRLCATYPTETSTMSRLKGKTCDLMQADTDVLEKNLTELLDFASDHRKSPINHIVVTAGNIFTPFGLEQTRIETFQSVQQVRIIAPTILAKLLSPYTPASPSSSYTLTSGAIHHVPTPGYGMLSSIASQIPGLTRVSQSISDLAVSMRWSLGL